VFAKHPRLGRGTKRWLAARQLGKPRWMGSQTSTSAWKPTL